MKNWKKLLACLLVGLMALTVFTACDASVGEPMEAKRPDAKSAEALCTRFGVTYDKDLSEKAYSIANWIVNTSPSYDTKADKPEFYRVGIANANNAARAFLKEGNYATAFESLNIGTFGPNNFVPGFAIETEWSSKHDSITFVLPRDDIYPEAMTTAAKDKSKLGVAYVADKGVSYAVVLFGE